MRLHNRPWLVTISLMVSNCLQESETQGMTRTDQMIDDQMIQMMIQMRDGSAPLWKILEKTSIGLPKLPLLPQTSSQRYHGIQPFLHLFTGSAAWQHQKHAPGEDCATHRTVPCYMT